jgi:hypothetical protein
LRRIITKKAALDVHFAVDFLLSRKADPRSHIVLEQNRCRLVGELQAVQVKGKIAPEPVVLDYIPRVRQQAESTCIAVIFPRKTIAHRLKLAILSGRCINVFLS